MRQILRELVPAPSPTLLRFLKSQTENVCCFTSNPRTTTCQSSRQRAAQIPPRTHTSRLPSSTKPLTTTPRHQATVQVSSFNIDSLRQLSTQTTPKYNIITGASLLRSPLSPQGNRYSRRSASTDSRPLLKRFWKQRGRKEGPGLNSNDLPPLPSFLDDVGGTSIGRNKPGKSGSELKLRCTEIDENGNVTTVNGEFKKSELIAKVGAQLARFSRP